MSLPDYQAFHVRYCLVLEYWKQIRRLMWRQDAKHRAKKRRSDGTGLFLVGQPLPSNFPNYNQVSPFQRIIKIRKSMERRAILYVYLTRTSSGERNLNHDWLFGFIQRADSYSILLRSSYLIYLAIQIARYGNHGDEFHRCSCSILQYLFK